MKDTKIYTSTWKPLEDGNIYFIQLLDMIKLTS